MFSHFLAAFVACCVLVAGTPSIQDSTVPEVGVDWGAFSMAGADTDSASGPLDWLWDLVAAIASAVVAVLDAWCIEPGHWAC